ncbi:hypothetical protein RN001_015424 [Aquatica leii]|uniref:gamma-glutamylcyclotransferase n=1 Tax=Aquatica leii TaxID=1421715 RepID=A0AAN7PZC8_9COLE|nr:hypothetical protein RN001_015424 [Aquatica leii]
MPDTFAYFAYGSNLLAKRMHLNNPSAIRIGVGRLNNYRLDFTRYSKRWHGCSATIVPHNGYFVWGALWEVSMKDLPNLDRQEGVHQSIYHRFLINAELLDGSVKECYVYEQVTNPTLHYKLKELPLDRQPSQLYKDTITKGASESKLPDKYQELLLSIACNNFNGDKISSRFRR